MTWKQGKTIRENIYKLKERKYGQLFGAVIMLDYALLWRKIDCMF